MMSEMNPKKIKTLGWGALFFGLFYLGFGLISPKDENSLIILLFGLIAFLAGALIIWFQKKKKQNFETASLNALFYDYLKSHDGKITVVQLAVAANIDGIKAKEYLEKKALEFSVTPEIDENGTVIYHFK